MKIIKIYQNIDSSRLRISYDCAVRLAAKIHGFRLSKISQKVSRIISNQSINIYNLQYVVVAQQEDKAIVIGYNQVIIIDEIDGNKNIEGKIVCRSDDHIRVLIDNFNTNEISIINNNITFFSNKDIYITRASYDRMLRKKKEHEQRLEQQKVTNAQKKIKQEDRFNKYSKLKERKVKIDKFSLHARFSYDKKTFSLSVFPILVKDYLPYSRISLCHRATWEIPNIIGLAFEYYYRNIKKYPEITIRVYTNTSDTATNTNLHVGGKINFKHDPNNKTILINDKYYIHSMRLKQVLDYITVQYQNPLFSTIFNEFIEQLKTFNTEQIKVLTQQNYKFTIGNIKIPFTVGVNKKGWYIQFKRKHNLPWSSLNKKDIKHVLSYAHSQRYPYYIHNELELVHVITSIIPNIENEIIQYIQSAKLLSKI